MRTTIVFSVLAFLLNFWLTPHAGAVMEDRIVAIVNDEIITLQNLRDYIRSTYISLSTQGMPDDELREIMMDMEINGINKLIEDKLMLSRAKSMGLEVREEAIDARVEEVKERYGSESRFINALVSNGATITDLRNKIKDEFQIKYVVDVEVGSKVFINPQEVTEYYKKNADQFKRGARVNLDSIFIRFGANKFAARERAKEALEKLRSGALFSDIASGYSQAPSIGMIEEGQIMENIEKVVFAMDVGEISEPLETDSGVYIFKLIAKLPPQLATLSETKDSIKRFLHKEKFKSVFDRWLNKLKDNAYIEIKE